jgi:hypothetical protein
MDVSEYPDSGKINISPMFEQYERKSKVSYFTGEENVLARWNELREKK